MANERYSQSIALKFSLVKIPNSEWGAVQRFAEVLGTSAQHEVKNARQVNVDLAGWWGDAVCV
jgi:hypothetical protein